MMNYLTLGLAALCFTGAVANAQVTVTSVRVTVSSPTTTAVYCDDSLACAATGGIQVWNLGTGVNLAAGETLVLTQTGLIASLPGGNFDTSDRVRDPGNFAAAPPYEKDCTVGDPCNVAIEINGVSVYNSAAPISLNAFNNDLSTPEGSQWAAPVAIKPNYTLRLGYADNEHASDCATICFPTPFETATVFKGAPLGAVGAFCTSNCYDAGALLITGVQVVAGCTLTQGGYKNHFNYKVLNLPPPNITLGNVPYTNLQLDSVIQNNKIQGNGLLSLAHQLATAKLNIRYGASAPAGVLAAIAAADALIGNLVVPPVGSGYLNPANTSVLTGILDDFNNGVTGPGHCG